MMTSLLTKIAFLACLIGLLVVTGCEDSAPVPPPAVAAKPKPAKHVAEKVKHQAPAPKKPAYVYSSSGQRDPFAPLAEVKKRGVGKRIPLLPLQKFDLSQFRVLGIIVGKGEPSAMVSVPGGKTYILKKGVKVGKNDGVVKNINAAGINVLEKFYDFSGAVRTKEQMIKLPPRRGVI